MKKTIKILFVAFIISVLHFPMNSYAQPTSYYTLSWNMVFPTGEFRDWVDKVSLTGFDFGAQYYVTDGVTAGFNIGSMRVDELYEKETFTDPDKGIAITADNSRITWMIPFQGSVAYHFIPEAIAKPYISLGIGGDYMTHHLLIQEYDIYQEQWDFSLTPEIGLRTDFGVNSSTGLLVAFNYKWTTNKIELYEGKSNNLSMMNLKVGLIINVD